MKHLGDITKISGHEAPTVDCVIGGSPCQDLSVAGKRAGLAGERSGLYMEQIRIIKEMREHDRLSGRTGVLIRPRYMVWENVPGAFSSNGGKDFAAVLEEAIRIAEPEAPDVPVPPKGWPTSGCIRGMDGRWSIAWRVLDAQFWGVPQRRRRIALVADFGGDSASEILFVREGVRGYLEESEPQRKEAAGDAGASTGVHHRDGAEGKRTINLNNGDVQSKAVLDPSGIAPSLYAGECRFGGGECYVLDKTAVAFDAYNQAVTGDKTKTLNSAASDADHVPVVIEAAGCDIYNLAVTGDKVCSLTAQGYGSTGTSPKVIEPAYTLKIRGGCEGGGKGDLIQTDKSATLSTLQDQTLFQPICMATQQGGAEVRTDDKAPTLTAAAGMSGNNQPVVCYHDAIDRHILDDQGGQQIGVRTDGKSPTLRAEMHGNVPCVFSIHCNAEENKSPVLKARDWKDPHVVVYAPTIGLNAGEVAPTLVSSMGNAPTGTTQDNLIVSEPHGVRYIVRRLTPLECERLQGFPDGWTDIGEWVDSKGKKHKDADSPRYKALGNSIAIPPWKWVLKRICACYERDATMASLFDGIGGFPYIWEQLNGKGSCLWASEIEEFPMAVTKLRFGGAE